MPKPHLSELDPELFAADLVEALAARTNTQLVALGLPPVERLTPAQAPLYRLVLGLARYAVEGVPMAHLQEAMAYLQVQLFASIAQPTPEGHLTGAEDPKDLPGSLVGWAQMVLLAAQGRAELEAGRSVSAGELAALASTSADYVRQLVQLGELRGLQVDRERPTTGVRSKDARAWAAARGVHGL
jgi:hypothetical protein